MVTQKMISVRIDLAVLQQLEMEARVTGCKKNMLINRAIKDYIRIVDIIRRARAVKYKPIDTAAMAGQLKIMEDTMNITWRI